MPSGRTHDRITIWTVPLVAIGGWWFTHQAAWTLLAVLGYLFGGLMFGPDLDIHSVQYKRWGWFRWIWLPYRASMRHRSRLSHGPILGTTLRVIYIGLWFGLLLMVVTGGLNLLGIQTITAAAVHDRLDTLIRTYPQAWVAAIVGIELGALSHVMSDGLGSWRKRQQKRGRQRSRSKR